MCALIVCASIVQACASTRTSGRNSGDAADAAEACNGDAFLIVRNPGHEVEIVEGRRRSSLSRVIAIVPTGVHELPIRSDPDYGYYARPVEGRRVLGSTSRRQGTRGVSLERKCLQHPGVSLVP
jgi:hypothetical protein